MASVYILYSSCIDKYYVGYTKDLETRLKYHQTKEFESSFTAKMGKWDLFFVIPDLTITTAIKIEDHIKRMKSRVYLENLKRYPQITKRLIEKYSDALPR